MRLYLLGVRGSTPAPGPDFVRYGGHTSCVALANDEEAIPRLVLDAGTGLRTVSALLDGAAFDGVILLTHLHWDHFQGLPFFAGGDREDANVELFLPDQGDGTDAESVLARGMSPPQFPIRPRELRGDWKFDTLQSDDELERSGFTAIARSVPHKGGTTFGYRVSDDHSSLAYIPDHNPTQLGRGPDGWGEYHRDALALADGVDMLIHDAHLVADELEREASFGHAAAEYAIALAKRAGARRVVLFHHKPDRTDDMLDEFERRFGDASVPVSLAREGTVLQL